jgi:hypothetical protein
VASAQVEGGGVLQTTPWHGLVSAASAPPSGALASASPFASPFASVALSAIVVSGAASGLASLVESGFAPSLAASRDASPGSSSSAPVAHAAPSVAMSAHVPRASHPSDRRAMLLTGIQPFARRSGNGCFASGCP